MAVECCRPQFPECWIQLCLMWLTLRSDAGSQRRCRNIHCKHNLPSLQPACNAPRKTSPSVTPCIVVYLPLSTGIWTNKTLFAFNICFKAPHAKEKYEEISIQLRHFIFPLFINHINIPHQSTWSIKNRRTNQNFEIIIISPLKVANDLNQYRSCFCRNLHEKKNEYFVTNSFDT